MRLTDEQWRKAKAPFHYMRIVCPAKWDGLHFDMLWKWLDANTKGWWYGGIHPHGIDRKTMFMFEHLSDMTIFKMWISDDPFKTDVGYITIEAAVDEMLAARQAQEE